jgi:hypothetical protein
MKFYPADYMRDGELWVDADNFERALAKLNRIALAVAGNRDDPLGDDFLDEIGLPTAVQGLTGALEGVAHDAGGLILQEGHHNGHETLPVQAAAQLSQSFTFGQKPCGCRDNSIELAILDRSRAYDPRRAK